MSWAGSTPPQPCTEQGLEDVSLLLVHPLSGQELLILPEVSSLI